MTQPVLDAERCEALALRAKSGDAAARRELVELLWPFWISMVQKSRSMAGLARSEDHVHDVVTRLVEKIGRPDARGLGLYPAWRERHPEKTFLDWIRIVTKNAVRDYVREKLGSTRTQPGEISVKRLLNEFASSPALDELGIRPPFTLAQTARELVEFARARLSEAQLRALGLWLEGADFEEIAEELTLSAEQARKLMRSAVATLRRHFEQPLSKT